MEPHLAQVVGNSVLESLKEKEKSLDAELDRLNNLDDDDLERIRANRLQQMKQQAEKTKGWIKFLLL